jgi:hypothetical protein
MSEDTFAKVQELLAAWASGSGDDEQREVATYMLAMTNVWLQDGEPIDDILLLLDSSAGRFMAAGAEVRAIINESPQYLTPEELFDLLRQFTLEVYDFYGIAPVSSGENNYGPYEDGAPSGHVLHYTASPNSSVSRLKTLLKRFAVNSTSRVGVNFIIFDCLHSEITDIRSRYPELYGPAGVFKVDVLHMGLLAFWASNWANRYTLSTENRNVGKLFTEDGETFYWGGSKNIGNPSYLYTGRTPVQVRGMWAEPFTDDQIRANEYLCRKTREWMQESDQFDPLNFMSHHMIHSTKWDVWPQFPFGRMKAAICNDAPLDLEGYIAELDSLSCPKVVDDGDNATAERFLVTFDYLTEDWRELASDEDKAWSDAVKNLQRKKDIQVDGIVGPQTRTAMNQCRSAYKLT